MKSQESVVKTWKKEARLKGTKKLSRIGSL